MVNTCTVCKRNYDDEKQWTICPHGPLDRPLRDYCPRCDTLASVHGPCCHQQATSQQSSNSDLDHLCSAPNANAASDTSPR